MLSSHTTSATGDESTESKFTPREMVARAIWAKRPDCQGKPWPMNTPEQRRAYPHNPVAACDLCFIYADAAIAALEK